MAASWVRKSLTGEKVELTQSQFLADVGVTPALVLKPDPDRIAIMVQNTGPNGVYLAINPDVAAQHGLSLPVDSRPILLTDEHLPGYAARGFYAVTGTATSTLEIIDVRLT